jgi:nucleoside-diphosphate-sugar epimerase
VSLAQAIATLGEVMSVEPKVTRRLVEAGDVRDTWADVGRAAEYIGYVPTTHLTTGLAQKLAWFAGKSEGSHEIS